MSQLQIPSLAMLSNPLPQVVVSSDAFLAKKQELEKKYADYPVDDVKAPEVQLDVQSEVLKPEKDKIVIILHTKDVSQEDRELLKKFGKIRDMNYSMYNLPLEDLDCHYLLVDCREKLNKMHITRVDVNKFKFVAYVQPFQKHDNIFEDFLDDINVMTKFPKDYKVAFKSEFDDVLTSMKRIKNSSCFLSFVSFLVNGFQAVMKK